VTELLLQYGLFLAQSITIVIAIIVVAVLVISLASRNKEREQIEINKLNEKYDDMRQTLQLEILPKNEIKKVLKEDKQKLKKEKKHPQSDKKRIYVINFTGDIKASAVTQLREEITAILMLARTEDEVFVKLESGGGLVHAYGLASSQLMRIRNKGIPLTVCVDKVAASGGYMMACVANKIIAAPFAILGSIGVLAQIPNFHRLLKSKDIDFEQFTAGEYKRTVTVFGENTDAGRTKFKEELEETHVLFKNFVLDNRPGLDMSQVATGEHWFGIKALELKLVDELKTSDDYLLDHSLESDLYEITYAIKKPLGSKLSSFVQLTVEKLFFSWWQQSENSRFQ